MKYLYEMSTELEMSYLDKVSFMNHIKNFAKKDLGISSDNTPYLLDLDMKSCGKTVSYRFPDGTNMMGYIAINESQQLYEMINTILHETKHLEQYRKQPLYYRISSKIQQVLTKYHLYFGLAYTLAFHEIDARRYARKTMKKYIKEFNALIKKAYNNELDGLYY